MARAARRHQADQGETNPFHTTVREDENALHGYRTIAGMALVESIAILIELVQANQVIFDRLDQACR